MARFNPGSNTGGGSGGSFCPPAGDYIIALRSFQRKRGKRSGKDYLRCRWVLCAGALKKKTFFANMSVDVSVDGTAQRWQIYCEACDVKEEFELGDSREGTAEEGDENIRRLFVNVPFKVRLKNETNGGYTNADIAMIHYPRTWTDSDKEQMDAWLDEQEGQSDPQEGDDDDSDADPPPPVRGGGGFADDGYGGSHDDDDIPF